MSVIYFISDLHLGHKNIINFAKEYRHNNGKHFETVSEHDDWIVAQWNSKVRPRDTVYALGDVAFTREGLDRVKELNGNKMLIMGNHDIFSIEEYQDVGFTIKQGILSYKGFWLSHAPIHPLELRGKLNVMGHVHHNTIPDHRYISVCVEACCGIPISLDELRDKKEAVQRSHSMFQYAPLTNITEDIERFEVIDHTDKGTGRDLVRYGAGVTLSFQDGGKTLKVFLSKKF